MNDREQRLLDALELSKRMHRKINELNAFHASFQAETEIRMAEINWMQDEISRLSADLSSEQ